MFTDRQDQVENEFRNIKLKLKGPKRHSELQAVKALMAMSAQANVHPRCANTTNGAANPSQTDSSNNKINGGHKIANHTYNAPVATNNSSAASNGTTQPMDLSRSESPEPIYGLSITMTEEEFKILAQREGIEDVIGEPICKLCGGLFSGPLGIALHMCPAMKRQTYRCDICGEDKWKTKANLHSHIKWCKRRLSMKTEQSESKQIY